MKIGAKTMRWLACGLILLLILLPLAGSGCGSKQSLEVAVRGDLTELDSLMADLGEALDEYRPGDMRDIARQASSAESAVQDFLDTLAALEVPAADTELALQLDIAMNSLADMLLGLLNMPTTSDWTDMDNVFEIWDLADFAYEDLVDLREMLTTPVNEMLALARTVQDFIPDDAVIVDDFDDPMVAAENTVMNFLNAVLFMRYDEAAGYLMDMSIANAVIDEHIAVIDMGLMNSFEMGSVQQSMEAVWTVYVDFIGTNSRVQAWYEVQPTELGFFITVYSFEFFY